MKTIVGLFDTNKDVEQAVGELANLGIMRSQMSIVARDAVLRERYVGLDDWGLTESVGAGAMGGTAIGGLIGWLAGLSTVTLPGIGPVITAGALATTLGSTALGAGLGAATGGLIGALTSAGIPEPDAHVYAESVKRGGILLSVTVTDERVSPVIEAFDRANAVDITARREELRRSGWDGFDSTTG